MMRCYRGLVAVALSILMLASGCRATAQVAVEAQPDGTGVVNVTVTLDRAAVAAVGNVATDLRTGDLPAAGWTVSGPRAGAGGTTVITVTKPFSTLAGASSIVEEIAGSGPAASRPFQVAISQRKTFWKTTTVLKGSVNLRCGLGCFGDPGLLKTVGSATGINPATAEHDTGVNPASVFYFAMAVSLPGKLKSTNALTRNGTKTEPQLGWTPALGSEVPLLAMTETTNAAHVKDVVIAGVIGLLVVLGLIVWLVAGLWRRRRRRRRTPGTSAEGQLRGTSA